MLRDAWEKAKDAELQMVEYQELITDNHNLKKENVRLLKEKKNANTFNQEMSVQFDDVSKLHSDQKECHDATLEQLAKENAKYEKELTEELKTISEKLLRKFL